MLKCNLSNSNLTRADLSEVLLKGSFLSNLDAQESTFRRAKLMYSDLRSSKLQGSNFQGSKIRDSDLRDCDFRNCKFELIDLRGADLRGARFDEINFETAKLGRNIILPRENYLENIIPFINQQISPAVSEEIFDVTDLEYKSTSLEEYIKNTQRLILRIKNSIAHLEANIDWLVDEDHDQQATEFERLKYLKDLIEYFDNDCTQHRQEVIADRHDMFEGILSVSEKVDWHNNLNDQIVKANDFNFFISNIYARIFDIVKGSSNYPG